MKRHIIFLVIACLLSCRSSSQSFNPEARKLNDSAISLKMKNFQKSLSRYGNEDSITKVQITLLNQATLIDSSYIIAYLNKFSFQNELKLYKDAAVTGKHLIKLMPDDPTINLYTAESFDRAGDTISARKHYLNALFIFNKRLDTMSVGNRKRKSEELNKAMALIMLGQQQKGRDLLQKLYDHETNSFYKSIYKGYMNKTKSEILYITTETVESKTF